MTGVLWLVLSAGMNRVSSVVRCPWLALLIGLACGVHAAALAQTIRTDALAFEANGQNAAAAQIWHSIAERDPGNAEAFAHQGLMEARQEHYSQAIAFYRQADAIDPAFPGLQMNMGLAYFKSELFRGSIKPFTLELRKHPGDERLIILLGMAHYGMGDYLVAVPFLQQASEKQPQNLVLRLALAHSCLWSKQYDCVLATYKQILNLDPSSAEAEMIAGEALDETGDDAGATEHFRAAVAANPNEPNVHFGLGYLLWTQSHYTDAVKEFAAELGNDPQNLPAKAYLGDSYVKLNDYAKAQPELEVALTRDPSSAMVHRDLGIVLASEGNREEAATELLRAIALDPQDSAPHWRLARLYQSMGKSKEAAAEFAKVSTMKKEANEPLAHKLPATPPVSTP
jgi:tetratricopeptide (TPR) repeat protein